MRSIARVLAFDSRNFFLTLKYLSLEKDRTRKPCQHVGPFHLLVMNMRIPVRGHRLASAQWKKDGVDRLRFEQQGA